LGSLPIIAEDPGPLHQVVALRDDLGLPGMKILQLRLAAPAAENLFLPHNHVHNCVALSFTIYHCRLVAGRRGNPEMRLQSTWSSD
jgi:4-alpha-glucanotransferase